MSDEREPEILKLLDELDHLAQELRTADGRSLEECDRKLEELRRRIRRLQKSGGAHNRRQCSTQTLFAGFAVLGVLAYQGKRWAFMALIALAVVYFPVRSNFLFVYRPCEVGFDWPLAAYSLRNFNNLILFFAFFLMVAAQLPMSRPRHFAIAIGMTVAMGVIVEVSEATWGRGNCRLRDLIPDGLGALIGAGVVMVRSRMHR